MNEERAAVSSAKVVRRHLMLAGTIALLAVVGMAAGADAVGDDENAAAAPGRPRDAFAHGRAAVERLGLGLPDVAARHGVDPGALRRMLLSDRTLAVDHLLHTKIPMKRHKVI